MTDRYHRHFIIVVLGTVALLTLGCLEKPKRNSPTQSQREELQKLRQQLALFRTRFWETLEGRELGSLEIADRRLAAVKIKRITTEGVLLSHANGMGNFPFSAFPDSLRHELLLLEVTEDAPQLPKSETSQPRAQPPAEMARIQADHEAQKAREAQAWRESEIERLESENQRYRAGIQAQKRMRSSLEQQYNDEDRRRTASEYNRRRGETKPIITSSRDRQINLSAYDQKIGQLESLILRNEEKIRELRSQ